MTNYLTMTAAEVRALPDFNQVYYTILADWRAEVAKLASAKNLELTMRTLLSDLTFPNPTEGTQHHAFGAAKGAAKLTLQHVINRSIDPAAIGPCLETLRATIGVKADDVVKFKPDLGIAAYKSLTEEQKAILAPAITAKPGSPQLKFNEAKE